MGKKVMASHGAVLFGAVMLLAGICCCGCGAREMPVGRGGGGGELQKAGGCADVSFLSARPVWPEGREGEMNLFVGFRAVFGCPRSGRAVLRIAGSSVYRIFLNGEFVGYGPARGPHGWYRVDEWELPRLAEQGGLTTQRFVQPRKAGTPP